MYEIIFDSKAVEFLSGLPKPIKKRIFNKILFAKENPFHFFESLEGRSEFKLRIGDYRVIADISKSSEKIEVTLIGHRKNIYKRL